jgi:hypothetical protein
LARRRRFLFDELVGAAVAAAFGGLSYAIVIYESRPPSEIVLKTEKVTLVLEGIGDRKIPLHRKVLGGREGHP